MTSRRTLLAIGAAIAGTALSAAVGLSADGFAAGAARTAPTEHILGLQTDPNGSMTIIAGGPIHARGKDVELSQTRDRFVFPKGNLIIVHHVLRHHDARDRTTCLFTHTESGSYTVVRGTRAYANVSGRGSYSLLVQGVGCSQSSPPDPFQVRLHASGPLSLG